MPVCVVMASSIDWSEARCGALSSINLKVQPMELTCVINVRNGERYLDDTLQSIFSSGGDISVVLVDNQSTDRTMSIATNYPNLTYVRTPCLLSLGAARNYSLLHARSAYVTWLDSDDQWSPEFFKEYSRAAALYPEAVMISSGSLIIDSEGRLLPLRKQRFLTKETDSEIIHGDTLERLVSRIGMIDAWCSYVFKTSEVRAVGGIDVSFQFAEDLDLVGRLLAVGSGVHIQRNLTFLRYHPQQLTRKLAPELRSSEILKCLENAVEKSGKSFDAQLSTARAVLEFKSTFQTLTFRPSSAVAFLQFLRAAANFRVWRWLSDHEYLQFLCRQAGISRKFRAEQLKKCISRGGNGLVGAGLQKV